MPRKKVQKKVGHVKEWLHRSPCVRKEDSVKEEWGDLAYGNVENGNMGP